MHPPVLLALAPRMQSTHEVEREPAAAASTRSGRMSRSPSAGSSELQGSSSTRSRLKEDFVLTVEVGCMCSQGPGYGVAVCHNQEPTSFFVVTPEPPQPIVVSSRLAHCARTPVDALFNHAVQRKGMCLLLAKKLHVHGCCFAIAKCSYCKPHLLTNHFACPLQEQPSQPGQPPAKRRRVCVGEVKQPSVLLSSVEDLPDLVAAYTQQDNERHRQAVAVIRQVYTYLQVGRLCHGYITCWFGTWLVYCPSQQRDTLYVSQAYGASTSASSTQSAVTAMGALAWLQDQALQVDPSQVAQYKAPAPGQAGGGEADPDYNSGEDAGALDGSQDEWHPDIDSSMPRSSSKGSGPSSSSKSGSSSRGRGLSSGRPQQQGGRVTLLLQDKLQEGSAGAVVLGAYGGMPAVVKLLGPDGPGLRAYETEAAMYSMLACVQGVVVPRLLGTGSLPGGVMFLATSRVDGTPLSSFRTVPTAVADAALRALATLHRKFAGFLHNDIRLANILLLSNPAMSDVSPKCMLLDFGRSRADGTKAEQQWEYMALKKLLGA